MSNIQKYRRLLWILLTAALLLCASYGYRWAETSIPDEITVYEGEKAQLEEALPSGIFRFNEEIAVLGADRYQLQCNIFSMIPVKTVTVQSTPRKYVYISGETVGIYMETEGVMIIGSGEVDAADEIHNNPAEHIVKSGDYILEVNGKSIESKKELIQQVSLCKGEEMELLVQRGLEQIDLALHPVLTKDGSYKLGIWVRDNIQGIGTLTYVTEDGSYGALGHGISDIDTGQLLTISRGDLYQANVFSIAKGQEGNPGELKGVITYQDDQKLGTVNVNQYKGISGTLNSVGKSSLMHQKVEVGLKQEIQEGSASIFSNVDGEVQEYDVQIEKINYDDNDSNKSFVIRVTDESLLKKTGGIVQGMSGSPIIQDGKLVGAVTHVLVNDPTRGYGIFIENMLEAAS